ISGSFSHHLKIGGDDRNTQQLFQRGIVVRNYADILSQLVVYVSYLFDQVDQIAFFDNDISILGIKFHLWIYGVQYFKIKGKIYTKFFKTQQNFLWVGVKHFLRKNQNQLIIT